MNSELARRYLRFLLPGGQLDGKSHYLSIVINAFKQAWVGWYYPKPGTAVSKNAPLLKRGLEQLQGVCLRNRLSVYWTSESFTWHL